MTTPSIALARSQWHEVGTRTLSIVAAVLFAVGWVLVKFLRGVALSAAAVLFGIGWLARKVGPWCAAALREGWDAGQKPGGSRGPA